jgi:hypothetical protein
MTIAISDDLYDMRRIEVFETQLLTIQNVQSFYNYRSVKNQNNEFILVSSILSSENHFIEIEQTNEKKKDTYEVIPEERIQDEPTNLLNLYLKKHRINCALNKIKEKISNDPTSSHTINQNINFYNYFSLEVDDNSNEVIDNVQRTMQNTCRPLPGSLKKPACINCKVTCNFSMENILHKIKGIAQNDILNELKLHGHPMSRIVKEGNTTRQRVTHEAARELADHYIYAHNKKEPVF